MGVYDDIESVEVRQRGQFFQPGKYRLGVKACKYFDGQRGETFVVEFDVLEAQKTDKNIEPNAVNTCASWIRTFEDKQKTKLSQAAIVEFVLAIMGKDPGNTADQDAIRPHLRKILERATGEENALEGREVSCEAFHTKTKTGGTFTMMRWAPVKEAA